MDDPLASTREFYDREGWTVCDDGRTVDMHLFGPGSDGPIRQRLETLHRHRAWAALDSLTQPIDLLEVGCGGNPGIEWFPLCRSYTGTDFSSRGLQVARERVAQVSNPPTIELIEADACALPMQDARFDAVFSAHMIYHIPDRASQARALSEMVRVLRPGGVLVLITANPRPLMWPGRLATRLAADTPMLGPMLRRLKRNAPLPYAPAILGWYRRQLSFWMNDIEIIGRSMPTTRFHQRISEQHGWGHHAWRLIEHLDTHHPYLSAVLGNYVMLTGKKKAAVDKEPRTQ
jgi:ubiquinone/menaquinone biosynthesis C-methylase UbiE